MRRGIDDGGYGSQLGADLFRERAPGKASRNMYLDAQGHPTRESIEGWRSSGVPGTVRGFEMAQKKYGRAT